MKLKLSLRLRFAGIIIILLTLVFGATMAARVHQNRQLLQAELSDRAQTFANLTQDQIVATYQSKDTQALGRYLAQLVQTDNSINGITLLTSDGEVLYSSSQIPSVTDPTPRAYFDAEGDLQDLVVVPSGGPVAAIAYEVSDKLVTSGIKRQIQSILTFSIIGTIVSAIVVLAVVDRSVIRPIRRLTDQAGRISQGDYETEPGHLRRSDEIGTLTQSMQAMQLSLKHNAEQLSQLDKAKSEFMMIASHSLRTPITVIKSSLEALDSEPVGPPSRRMLELAGVATQRLSSFAEDLLVVSTLEAGQQTIRLSPLPLDKVFEALIGYGHSLADEKGVTFVTDIQLPAGATIQANRPYLGNAVWNVIDNAIKFTSAGGTVAFRLTTQGDRFVITVDDSGIGIEEAEQAKIFDKLHRGTSTEQYDYEGSGIGLYVTKKIIESHNGTVSVVSRVGEGTALTITLPLDTIIDK